MKKSKRSYIYLALMVGLVSLIMESCGGNYTPKPRGYFRIALPKKSYALFDSTGFPYSFEYPKYAKLVPDREAGAEPYWVNINFRGYKAVLHLSYKRINNDLPTLLEDVHAFVYKHTIKADAILETAYSAPERKVYGTLYDIEGNAASALQFYLTDSTKNFVRGALYFYTRPNKDSLAPVVEYFRKDVVRLVDTFNWRR
ncbi:gliding motility lipoprotein GldD [Acetobacteroides hydrogenigenes]|uniref:Gliding motility-associated lipoprotein GldD n=1 Tax=Acetobacteroides hydrogenigenes TaxID=979970 RepID=A0A4R2EV69_9BACT|nr:gliding motility lipoprotein GldD [Acetobacteroides hydrogenigenes]TCN73034.1 gliding motility-associated lipoprotein GldD [Acetobacteroides hydrogenigenes]